MHKNNYYYTEFYNGLEIEFDGPIVRFNKIPTSFDSIEVSDDKKRVVTRRVVKNKPQYFFFFDGIVVLTCWGSRQGKKEIRRLIDEYLTGKPGKSNLDMLVYKRPDCDYLLPEFAGIRDLFESDPYKNCPCKHPATREGLDGQPWVTG